jgi:hypothetical protein
MQVEFDVNDVRLILIDNFGNKNTLFRKYGFYWKTDNNKVNEDIIDF